MTSAKDHMAMVQRLHEQTFGTKEQHDLAKRLAAEKARADAEMAERFANLHMPEDIKSRAAAWGMTAWAEILWNSAFQAGYREAIRDRAALEGGE